MAKSAWTVLITTQPHNTIHTAGNKRLNKDCARTAKQLPTHAVMGMRGATLVIFVVSFTIRHPLRDPTRYLERRAVQEQSVLLA